MHKMAAFKRLRPATLLKKRLWHKFFVVNFVKFLRASFLKNTSVRMLLYYAKEEDESKQKFQSFLNFTKKIMIKKNTLTFFIFYLLCSSSFFSGFTFYKEALCLIIFRLSLCSNMLNLSRDEVFTLLFFFFSSGDEI